MDAQDRIAVVEAHRLAIRGDGADLHLRRVELDVADAVVDGPDSVCGDTADVTTGGVDADLQLDVADVHHEVPGVVRLVAGERERARAGEGCVHKRRGLAAFAFKEVSHGASG